ncbi:MAG TPA: GTPase [Pirellulales bacterium]|jgi:tRNA modification GTPase|nr:GTPase [Pirellulales bacterium]
MATISMNSPRPNPAQPDHVAVLTPAGRGAVASLNASGPTAAQVVQRHFQPHTAAGKARLAPGRIHVGLWRSAIPAETAAALEAAEEVVVCRLESERFEVHCHGGSAAAQRIVADFLHDGCALIPWHDWIALDESDPIRAAARRLLTSAQTERTAMILLDQYNGALAAALAEIEAALNTNSMDVAISQIDKLLARAGVGLHLVTPWKVVLAGPPNAGKSSLINALVGYQRSIVHSLPGTTRDALTAAAALDGWPVELIDTAGLRISADPLEVAGIARARQQIAAADTTLLIFDAAQPWSDESAALADEYPRATILHNKIDLLARRSAGDARQVALTDRPQGIATSALDGQGISTLIRETIHRLIRSEPPPGAAVPFMASHIEALREAKGRAQRTLRPQPT